MFETGIRQFRMAMSMVWGRRFDPDNIARLVADALETVAEFGEPGEEARHLTDGPLTDPKAQLSFASSGVKRTAERLAKESPFYRERFAAAGVDAAKLDLAGLGAVPVTVKADLIRQPADFLCTGSVRQLATRTTGTTGAPAEIWLSKYEMDLWPGLGALGAVIRDLLRPTDVMQVNVSSRATVTVFLDAAVARLVGAGCRPLGIIPADEALDSLIGGGATVWATCPSYLGQVEAAARRRGLGPADFRLRRIDVGGEVLSPHLARAARETFGAPANDLYGMTEVIPVTARTCSQSHLHHDINTGLVEYLDLATGEPAEPGAIATTVITPFFPYRECMPVFRYDTRDVVRRLDTATLDCELAGMPATSPILGKAGQLIRLGPDDVVAPRQFVEAIEALPTRPWPARFRAELRDGRIRLTVPESAIAGFGHAAAVAHLADHGLDVDLALVSDEAAVDLRPLRCDLTETTFVGRPALIGA
ncbi:MAG: phenylacetate--CoA ligase family protein [Catenulispora sp.]